MEGIHFFNLENITRHYFGCIDFYHVSATDANSFESERFLQFVNDGASLKFLDEANRGIEHKQSNNDAKVNPILETGS